MRKPYPLAAVLASLMLTASAGWAQETETSEEPNTAVTENSNTADEAAAGNEEAEAAAGEDSNTAVAYEEDGRYFTAEDIPTFNIGEDGTVDWLTYSGFRRYHAECHVCHGPDGEGSSYAPALKNSAVTMDYYDFYDVVVNGRHNGAGGQNSVMPSFGDNPNVMCYLDDIYVYLKARGTDALPRGRPGAREDKSEVITEDENACLGL